MSRVKSVTIEQAGNGYIIRTDDILEIETTLEGVFNRLLMHFENLSPTFTGEYFGNVVIFRRDEAQEFQVASGEENAEAEQPFEMSGKSGDGKSIFINGPHEIELELDRDDVDTKVIDRLAPMIVETLNAGWPTKRANAIAAVASI
jgi:hypothetical protein